MTRISKIAMPRVPRHAKDNRIEQESTQETAGSTQESTQETSDRYLVRVISNKQIKTPQKHRMKHLKNTE